MSDAEKARDEFKKRQDMIKTQWRGIAQSYPLAIEDLFQYLDSTREMMIKYGEERAMPHPLNPNESVYLDNETIAGLLQTSRACGMVKTYISARIESDVAQPIKKSK